MSYSKKSNVERALIGTDFYGVPTILATDGEWISLDCEMLSCGAEDIGLVDYSECKEPGLYLWEGHGEQVSYHDGEGNYEPEIQYTGNVRKVLQDETIELYKMKPR